MQDEIIIILSFNRHILEKTFIIVRFVNNNLFLISKIEYHEMIIKHYILLRPLAEIVNQMNSHCYSLLLMKTPYTFVVKLNLCSIGVPSFHAQNLRTLNAIITPTIADMDILLLMGV